MKIRTLVFCCAVTLLTLASCAPALTTATAPLAFQRVQFKRYTQMSDRVGISHGVAWNLEGGYIVTATHLLDGGYQAPEEWTYAKARGDVTFFKGQLAGVATLRRGQWQEGADATVAGRPCVLLKPGYAFAPEAAQGDSGAPVVLPGGVVVGVLSALEFAEGGRYTGLAIVEEL